MRAVVITGFGGPEVLMPTELPDPVPREGEVLLRVRACALNHLDLWIRQGLPSAKIKPPFILGCDGAGVSVAAVQIARKLGARVIATSTSAEKLERAKALGAESVIQHPPEELARSVRKLTGAKGVDLVFEHVGGAVFSEAIKCLRR